MNNKQNTATYSDHRLGLSSSYQVVAEIHNQNQDYWIVYLDNSHNSDYSTELNKPFLEVGRFEVKGQSFVILDVSMQAGNTAQDIARLLSQRELQIATLVAFGQANKQIAHQLRISEWTVSTYLRRIFAKLGVDQYCSVKETK